MKNKDKKNVDLNLTMQQKFNFDFNKLDEEDISKNRRIKKKNTINQKIKNLIAIKEKYKKKYYVFLVLFLIMTIGFIGILYLYISHPVIKEKEIVSENILFLGDSLTEIYDLDEFYGKDANVVNSGISGHTTTDILNNMKERVYRYNPSKVILLIGTNDIETGKSDKEIIDNIEKITKMIKKKRPSCKIYIESLYPINNTSDKVIKHEMVGIRTNERIKKINQKIEKYCINNDIIYIDMYDNLLDDDENLKIEYTIDGLHLSEDGFKVVTEILNRYI